MLKIIFWLLVGANAALFAYQGGYMDSFFPNGHEPARESHQINADKIRLLPASASDGALAMSAVTAPSASVTTVHATPAASAALTSSTAASTAAPAASPTTAPTTATAPSATSHASMASAALRPAVASVETAVPVSVNTAHKSDAVACTEIGNFTLAEAKRFSAQLASLSLGDHLSQRTVQEVASHIVYIPPQGDKEGADKKAGELRRLGINDFYVVQDNSSLRWGISLGVFKSEEAARQHLVNLNQKGVRTARIGERSVTSSAVVFRVKDLDANAKAALEKVKATFPRQEMKACDTAV